MPSSSPDDAIHWQLILFIPPPQLLLQGFLLGTKKKKENLWAKRCARTINGRAHGLSCCCTTVGEILKFVKYTGEKDWRVICEILLFTNHAKAHELRPIRPAKDERGAVRKNSVITANCNVNSSQSQPCTSLPAGRTLDVPFLGGRGRGRARW